MTVDDLDIHRAQQILDRDHYGLKKVKDRILETLAAVSYTHLCAANRKDEPGGPHRHHIVQHGHDQQRQQAAAQRGS